LILISGKLVQKGRNAGQISAGLAQQEEEVIAEVWEQFVFRFLKTRQQRFGKPACERVADGQVNNTEMTKRTTAKTLRQPTARLHSHRARSLLSSS
jgi:hypothetical protein